MKRDTLPTKSQADQDGTKKAAITEIREATFESNGERYSYRRVD